MIGVVDALKDKPPLTSSQSVWSSKMANVTLRALSDWGRGPKRSDRKWVSVITSGRDVEDDKE